MPTHHDPGFGYESATMKALARTAEAGRRLNGSALARYEREVDRAEGLQRKAAKTFHVPLIARVAGTQAATTRRITGTYRKVAGL